jgi:hypothetical protein
MAAAYRGDTFRAMARRPIPIAILACSALAHASPRTDPTTGRAVFTGSTVPHATSITLNPAALGLGLFDEIYLAFTSVLDQFSIDTRRIDLATDAIVDGDHVNANELGPGGMVAAVWHAGRFTLGFEAHTPPPEAFPGGIDAERFFTRGFRQRNIVATTGIAIRGSSRVYFGASLSHDNTLLHMRYARDRALDVGTGADCLGMPCGLENPSAEEHYDVRVRSDTLAASNLRVNLGVLVKVYRDVWVGLGYHTPPGSDIQSALVGTMRVDRAAIDVARGGPHRVDGDSTVYIHFPASIDGEVRTRLPYDLELHVGGRWEDLSRMQNFDVRGYGDKFRALGIPEWTLRPRGMHDAFALWAGVEQIATGKQALVFGGRIGIETAAVSDERTAPLNIAPASASLDSGVEWNIGNRWHLQLSYGIQVFRDVTVDDSDYDARFALDCAASGYDYALRSCAATRDGYAISTAAGNYRRVQHALRLGLRYDLQ